MPLQVIAPTIEEPKEVYDLRAAACHLTRASWNATVVTAREGALKMGEVVTENTAKGEAALQQAVEPYVETALDKAREAKASALQLERDLLAKTDELAAKAADMLPEALRAKKEGVVLVEKQEAER